MRAKAWRPAAASPFSLPVHRLFHAAAHPRNAGHCCAGWTSCSGCSPRPSSSCWRRCPASAGWRGASARAISSAGPTPFSPPRWWDSRVMAVRAAGQCCGRRGRSTFGCRSSICSEVSVGVCVELMAGCVPDPGQAAVRFHRRRRAQHRADAGPDTGRELLAGALGAPGLILLSAVFLALALPRPDGSGLSTSVACDGRGRPESKGRPSDSVATDADRHGCEQGAAHAACPAAPTMSSPPGAPAGHSAWLPRLLPIGGILAGASRTFTARPAAGNGRLCRPAGHRQHLLLLWSRPGWSPMRFAPRRSACGVVQRAGFRRTGAVQLTQLFPDRTPGATRA